MKLVSCNVIEDLIPLYAEDMLSEESKQLVEDHLDECEGCREYLKELQEMESLPIETDTKPLKKIQRSIQKKKWYAIMLTTLITLLIGALTVVFMTVPEYLSYSEETVMISETDDGFTLVDFDEEVAGYDLQSYAAENGRGTVYHLTTWSTTWHQLTDTKEVAPIVLNQNGEQVEAVYYYQTNGAADQLIYGEEQQINGGVVTLPRLSLNYFFGLAAIGLLICAGILYAVRSNKTHRERMTKITGLPLAYLLAHLVVTGWNATSYSSVRDLAAILLVAILLYGIFWVGIEFIKNRKFG